MIIFGTRMYGRKNSVRSHGRCPHCGRTTRLESYDGRKWFHLYFIPIIPQGGHVRVIHECASCDTGAHVPAQNVPAIIADLQKTADAAIVALGAGEHEMEIDGARRPVAAVLGGLVPDLYGFAGEKELRLLLDNLKAVGAKEELELAEAKAAEIRGLDPEAEARYRFLAAEAKRPASLFHAARYALNHGQLPVATALAERVETLLVDDLDVKQLLIDCYTAQKDWARLALAYEHCFLLAPDLSRNAAITKAYKQACKKAGRDSAKPPPMPAR
jgi:hypothetical protein